MTAFPYLAPALPNIRGSQSGWRLTPHPRLGDPPRGLGTSTEPPRTGGDGAFPCRSTARTTPARAKCPSPHLSSRSPTRVEVPNPGRGPQSAHDLGTHHEAWEASSAGHHPWSCPHGKCSARRYPQIRRRVTNGACHFTWSGHGDHVPFRFARPRFVGVRGAATDPPW
jgi:hypothetical protein